MNHDRRTLTAYGALALAALLTACGGGGGTPPTPRATATPTPTPTPAPISAQCTSGGGAQSVPVYHVASVAAGHGAARAEGVSVRGRALRAGSYHADLIEVGYPLADQSIHARISSTLTASGGDGQEIRRLEFASIGRGVKVLRVNPATAASQLQALRAQGLQAQYALVAHAFSTDASLAQPNDPYYTGFTQAQINTNNGGVYQGGQPTFDVPPFYGNTTIPSQWDLHVVCAANAWAYSMPNTTGHVYVHATGSTTINIAVLDTGIDYTHPDFAGTKITYLQSDVTPSTPPTNSPAPPVTGPPAGLDDNGHGSNVSGIAAADTNNGFGFAGVGYNSSLQGYKVLDASGNGNDFDIAQAVNQAVLHGARVINLSLGFTDGCAFGTPGGDPSVSVGTAIQNALAANVVVVAAAGNGDTNTGIGYGYITAPACDTGVIAVGATVLDDSNPSAVVERLTTYSNYSSGQWGLLAPGGDTPQSTDTDHLHYFFNVTSSVPGATYGGPPSAANGNVNFCTSDLANASGDCRIGFQGTSQATPHVTGAVALLLAVNDLDLHNGPLTPAKVFSLLCNSARNIGDPRQGCGRLDVYRAMALLVGDPAP